MVSFEVIFQFFFFKGILMLHVKLTLKLLMTLKVSYLFEMKSIQCIYRINDSIKREYRANFEDCLQQYKGLFHSNNWIYKVSCIIICMYMNYHSYKVAKI